MGIGHGVGHFTVVVSGRALPFYGENAMLRVMNRNSPSQPGKTDGLDTEGHRLVVLDRPSGRKPAHMAEQRSELRLRGRAKESRSNKPDRY